MSVVALVYSNWTVQKISDFLEDFLDAKMGDVGLVKIERFRVKSFQNSTSTQNLSTQNSQNTYKDSNRTLLLMKRELFERAITAGLNFAQPNLDFRITEFVLDAKHLPYEGFTSNLYMVIPKTLGLSDAEALIGEKLKMCVTFGLLQETQYSLRTPLKSRITGEHRGFMVCAFTEEVPVNVRALIRALLHDSYLFINPQNNTITYLPTLWTRKNKVTPVYKILKKE